MHDAAERWHTQDAADLYETARWGGGYISVSEKGDVVVHPDRHPGRGVDLKELVDRLVARGVDLPVLLRFNGILRDRLTSLHNAFSKAISDHDYPGRYSCVFPIKVNQQRQVVEEVLRHSGDLGFGLEAGSKPELLAVIALAENATPIICNGFKDAVFIETALLAQKIGRQVMIVIEKYTELELILRLAEKVGVEPVVGMRIKLASRGAGRWKSSAGHRSKFGLTAAEVLRACDELAARGKSHCFKLLHFHLGSQITNIRQVKAALVEAARVYAQLVARGAPLEYLDVGGGLGVDYDGSQTNFESSMNYTLEEYAGDVIYHVQQVCDEAEITPPNIISESGRAVAAYHSVLVFGVLGVSGQAEEEPPEKLDDDADSSLFTLLETWRNVSSRNAQESYHDALEALDMVHNAFRLGHLSLEDRARAESLFWAVCRRIRRQVQSLDYLPEELQGLDEMLSATYFCNFSLFQSMPDSWAIKQLFPVMPIHRLGERPTRHAILGDITCDSDGKIDQFINRRDVHRTLLLHERNDEPYYLAAFLLGAYQEILGDLHNLFGDTNAVHINLDDDGAVVLESIIQGDTVREVLGYVQYETRNLVDRLQASVEGAVRAGLLDHTQAGRFLRFYEAGLSGYTYLDEADGP